MGFSFGTSDVFLIVDVGGTLTSQFQGLSGGALVGAFSGLGLFLTCQAGDGNDIGLFTAVPEPSAAWVLGFVAIAMGFRRKRICPIA